MLVVSDWKSVIRAGGKMRKASFLYLLMASVLATAPARAQSALEDQIEALREDVIVLQRKAYRDKEAGVSAGSAQDVIVRLGEMDENLRQAVGKIDEMQYKLKTLEDKINLINKDVDMRLSQMEGKQYQGSGVNASVPAQKYDAPVAKNAPASIVGGSIAKGDDLAPVKTKSAEEIYQQGQDALKAGKSDEAAGLFTSLMTRYPEHKLAENAQYWLGEAYYAKKDFAKSAVTFAKGYEKYKKGNKGADNIFKLGMSFKELGKTKEACTAFINLPKEFPKAEAALIEKAKKQAELLKCAE